MNDDLKLAREISDARDRIAAGRESLDQIVRALVDAAQAANDAMRLYNRGGMKWMELDGIFARLDRVLIESREALAPSVEGCNPSRGKAKG